MFRRSKKPPADIPPCKLELLKKIENWCSRAGYKTKLMPDKPQLEAVVEDDDIMIMYLRVLEGCIRVNIKVRYLLVPNAKDVAQISKKDEWLMIIMRRYVNLYRIEYDEETKKDWIYIETSFVYSTEESDRGNQERFFITTGDVEEAFSFREEDIDSADEFSLSFNSGVKRE